MHLMMCHFLNLRLSSPTVLLLSGPRLKLSCLLYIVATRINRYLIGKQSLTSK